MPKHDDAAAQQPPAQLERDVWIVLSRLAPFQISVIKFNGRHQDDSAAFANLVRDVAGGRDPYEIVRSSKFHQRLIHGEREMAGFVKESGAPELDPHAKARVALEPHKDTISSMCNTPKFQHHPLYLKMLEQVTSGKDPAETVRFYNSQLTS